MIIGIDHIALSTRNMADGLSDLAGFGFSTKFSEYGLKNDPAKRDYLGDFRGKHDIAYCVSDNGGIAIELTHHSDNLMGRGAFNVVYLGKAHEGGVEEGDDRKMQKGLISSALGHQVVAVKLPCIGSVMYHSAADQDLGIECLVLEVIDLKESRKFYEELGFQVKNGASGGENWLMMEFKNNFVPHPVDLLLLRNKSTVSSDKLDNEGFTCLAMLTTNLAEENKRLSAAGIANGKIFELPVNNRQLKISLLRGRNGECIEMIEIPIGKDRK